MGARCPDAPSHFQTFTHPAPGSPYEWIFFFSTSAETDDSRKRRTSDLPFNYALDCASRPKNLLRAPDKVQVPTAPARHACLKYILCFPLGPYEAIACSSSTTFHHAVPPWNRGFPRDGVIGRVYSRVSASRGLVRPLDQFSWRFNKAGIFIDTQSWSHDRDVHTVRARYYIFF